MKRVIAAVVVLVLVIVGCIASLYISGREFSHLISLAQTAERCYQGGDMEGALQAAEQLAKEYPKCTKRFALFLPHQALTDLEKSTTSLPVILRYGDPRDFPAEARRCRLMLERLWDQELPTLENII